MRALAAALAFAAFSGLVAAFSSAPPPNTELRAPRIA
jgi:hypothetical protein